MSRCSPEHVLITNGSQQALDFLAKLFVGPGDTVLAARPTYLGALQAFSAYEAELWRVSRAWAVRTGSGQRAQARLPDAGLRQPERTHLDPGRAARGAGHGRRPWIVPVIEDAAYEQLLLRPRAAAVAAGAGCRAAGGIDAGRVIYCGTFSKTVVPGLRIGWIVAPRPVIEKLVLIKQASDLHTSCLNQMAMLAVAREIVPHHTAPDPRHLSRAA